MRQRRRPPPGTGRPPADLLLAGLPSVTHGLRRAQSDQRQENDGDGSGRCWVVTLRRGSNAVVVGRDLGRFTATVLSGELRALLHPRARQEGDTIE